MAVIFVFSTVLFYAAMCRVTAESGSVAARGNFSNRSKCNDQMNQPKKNTSGSSDGEWRIFVDDAHSLTLCLAFLHRLPHDHKGQSPSRAVYISPLSVQVNQRLFYVCARPCLACGLVLSVGVERLCPLPKRRSEGSVRSSRGCWSPPQSVPNTTGPSRSYRWLGGKLSVEHESHIKEDVKYVLGCSMPAI